MAENLASFEQELQGKAVEIVHHACRRDIREHGCKTCILGVLLTPAGLEIEQYMLSWLTQAYNVIAVRQPAPGTMFEYPALRYAQLYAIQNNEPVLYLHTKGAANPCRTQRRILNLWKNEFIDSKPAYEKHLAEADVLLPFSGPEQFTWLNGFIATPKAYAAIPPIVLSQDRYVYEELFRGSDLRFYCNRLDNVSRTETVDTRPLMYHEWRQCPPYFVGAPLLKKIKQLIGKE